MNSTPNPKPAEADDVLVARADERLAHAYEKIARADEQLARVTETLSKMEQDAVRHAATVPLRKPSSGGAALRGLIGLLLAAGIAVAAFASQSSYGDAAKSIISRWAPRLVSLSLPPDKSPSPAQPGPATVQQAAAETSPQQATASSPAAAPTVVPTSPDPAQLLQTMMRVLENVEQEVQELRAGQERMASDNARVVEQLRASQEQMTRLIARASEQAPAPRTAPQTAVPQTSAPLPRPIAGPARRPIPPASSSAAADPGAAGAR